MNTTLQSILISHYNGWELTADELAYIAAQAEHVTLTQNVAYVADCWRANFSWEGR